MIIKSSAKSKCKSFWMSQESADKIVEMAKHFDVKQSDVIRYAISRLIDTFDGAQKEAAKEDEPIIRVEDYNEDEKGEMKKIEKELDTLKDESF